MAKAIIDGVVIAESDTFEIVEGNVYFPPEAIKTEYFTETSLHTSCPWKGQASYYTLQVGDKTLENVAWFYPSAKPAANNIENYVAFYGNRVKVER